MGRQPEQTPMKRVLRLAYDRGINHFDLADSYANGEAEKAFGAHVLGIKRESLVIASKVALPVGDGPNDRGLSRKHITESLSNTLRNIGTDYLDVYYCHREDSSTPLEETLLTMNDLIKQGKIHYWGTSLWSPKSLKKVHRMARKWGLHPPRVEQPPYNLLNRWVERKIVPLTARLGMGLAVWSPLAGGALTGKYNENIPPETRGGSTDFVDQYLKPKPLQQIRIFCDKAHQLGHAPAPLALAWLLHQKGVTTVITGASHPSQLEQNLSALDISLSPQTLRALRRCFDH